MSNFLNKVIVVTGGYRGNGLAIVKKFLSKNAKVYSLDINFKKTRVINKNLTELKVNLEKYNEIKKAVNFIKKKEKKKDVLVNNAGISLRLPKKNISNYWNKTLAINLTAPYWLSLLCLPLLKRTKESNIVNITSLNGKIAMSNNPAYNASKGGLTALTFSLAMDFAKYKIRVNGVSPGYIKTNMTKKSYNNTAQYKKRVSRMMLGSYGTPEDVANTVLFLSSPEAKYINSTEVVVDGGLLKKGI